MSLKTINDLTAVDESQLQNNALIEGAIPPVSGSIFTPVKVTLAKLAKWILNSYTGLSLAGSSQSVKAAVDGLNGNYTSLVVAKLYTASFSMVANGSQVLGKTDFNISVPSGYIALGIKSFTTANSAVFVAGVNPEGNAEVARLHNVSSSEQSGTMTIRMLYIRTGAFETL